MAWAESVSTKSTALCTAKTAFTSGRFSKRKANSRHSFSNPGRKKSTSLTPKTTALPAEANSLLNSSYATFTLSSSGSMRKNLYDTLDCVVKNAITKTYTTQNPTTRRRFRNKNSDMRSHMGIKVTLFLWGEFLAARRVLTPASAPLQGVNDRPRGYGVVGQRGQLQV